MIQNILLTTAGGVVNSVASFYVFVAVKVWATHVLYYYEPLPYLNHIFFYIYICMCLHGDRVFTKYRKPVKINK